MNLLSICSGYIAKLLPMTYAVIGFSLLIIVHEFGHFLFCKLFDIHTPTFSVGFGPKIFEKKIGTTNFRLSALPLGGYVEIAGLAEVGQGEQEHALDTGQNAMSSKPYWQKFLVLMGGIGFNMAFAYIALISLFMLGAPKTEIRMRIVEDSLAAQGGLQTNDRLLMIDELDIDKKPDLLMSAMQKIKNGMDLKFTIMREGDKKEINVNIPFKSTSEKTILAPNSQEIKKPSLGIEFSPETSDEKIKLGFVEAVKKGVKTTHIYAYQIAIGIKTMFTKRSLKGAGGPVMILSHSAKLAQKGLLFLLGFLAFISINLALINLLPLPIFDGGQLLFTTIEAIIGREVPLSVKNLIHMTSVFLVLGLMVYLTFNDIKALIIGRLG